MAEGKRRERVYPALFLRDVERIWMVAEQAGPQALGQQLRAALCISSIASSTTRLDSDLLVGCVRQNIISHPLGLVLARQKPSLHERVGCLAALSDLLPVEERQRVLDEAIRTAQLIQDKAKQATALLEIAVRLGQSQQHLVYEQAKKLMGHLLAASRSYILRNTKHLWPPGIISSLAADAIEAARQDSQLWQRAWVLESLSQWLGNEHRETVLKEALKAAIESNNYCVRATVTATLALQLPEGERNAEIDIALNLARTIDNEWGRVHALRVVASGLPQTRLWEIEVAARAMENTLARSQLLADAALLLSSDRQMAAYSEALDVALGIEDGWGRAKALEQLVPRLPERLLAKMTEAAWAIDNLWDRGHLLAKLMPRLSIGERDEGLREAFASSQGIGDVGARAIALASFIPVISDIQQRDQVISEVLELAHSTWDNEARAKALGALAHWVREEEKNELLDETFNAAASLVDEDRRVKALIRALPVFSEHHLERALDLTQEPAETHYRHYRGKLLDAVIRHLPDALLAKAFEQIESIDLDCRSRASLFAHVIQRMRGKQRRGALRRALKSSEAKTDNLDLGIALLTLAPLLAPSDERTHLLKEALEKADESETIKARIFIQLAQSSEESRRQSFLAHALQVVRGMSNVNRYDQLTVYGEILPLLAGQEAVKALDEALSIARSESTADNRARVLGGLGIELQARQREIVLKEMLDTIAGLEERFDQGIVLVEFVEHLPDSLLHLAYDITIQLRNHYAIPALLGSLARKWEPMCRHAGCAEFQRLSATLHALEGCEREQILEVICALVPVILRIGGEPAISDTISAIRDTAQWWP